MICINDTFPTYLWIIEIKYTVWIYHWIHDIHSSLSYIEIWSIFRFEKMSKTISNFHVWCFSTDVLQIKLLNHGLKTLKWYPRILIEVNMVFIQM